MMALSIRQPWAYAILHFGKDIENRSWSTRFRGPVLIHAPRKIDHDALIDLPWEHDLPETFPVGGIVGQAEIVDCVSQSQSPWFCGPFGFVLSNAKPLPFRLCRGALGFFEPVLTGWIR